MHPETQDLNQITEEINLIEINQGVDHDHQPHIIEKMKIKEIIEIEVIHERIINRRKINFSTKTLILEINRLSQGGGVNMSHMNHGSGEIPPTQT